MAHKFTQGQKRSIQGLPILSLAVLLTLACSFTAGLFGGQETATPEKELKAPELTERPALETPSGSAPAGQENGRIAYLGNDGNIYTVLGDGSQLLQITTDAGPSSGTQSTIRIYRHPTWGPSGQRLAYLEIRSPTGESDKAILHTVSGDGSEPADAFNSATFFPFYLYWSPDGTSLTFLSNDPIGGRLVLHQAPARGGEPAILGRGQPFYWDWSPEGDGLVAHTGGASRLNANARLAFLIQNGQRQVDDIDLRPGFFQAPAWSPTGDGLLLVTEGDSEQDQLVLTDLQGRKRQVLTEFEGAGYVSWAPDGSLIGLLDQVPDADGGLEGVLSLLDPSQPAQMETLAQGQILAFFWSPDSQKIMYLTSPTDLGDFNVSSRGQGNTVRLELYVADLQTGEPQRLAAFSPPRDYRNLLPFFDQYQRSHTFWSPDSRRLVFASQEQNETPGIYVISADGGQPAIRIADGTVAFWSAK